MAQRIYETRIVDYVVIHCCQIRQRFVFAKGVRKFVIGCFYLEVFQISLMDVFAKRSCQIR